jgi:hypothetical protein
MLTDVDLLAWYTNLGLTESARVVIGDIRASDPARRVGTRAIKRVAGSVLRVRRMQQPWGFTTAYGRRGKSIGCTTGIFSFWRIICGPRFRLEERRFKRFLRTPERRQAFRWTRYLRQPQLWPLVTIFMP